MTIKYKLTNVSTHTYYSNGRCFNFAFCSKPSASGMVQLRSPFVACRETFIHSMIYRMRSRVLNPYTIDLEVKKIPISQVRFVVGFFYDSKTSKKNNSSKFELAVKKGIRIINLFERRHKWELTKLFKVEETKPNDTSQFYMIVGNKKWIRSTHMLSLYTLMLRLGNYIDEVKTCKNIIDALNKHIECPNNTVAHARATYKYWDMIMSNFDNIFSGLTTKHIYDINVLASQSQEGIFKLCSGHSHHNIIAERFNNVKENYFNKDK